MKGQEPHAGSGSARNKIGRLRVPTAAETAAQAIRNAIIVGELKVGERLPELKWAANFGIGQPTLREALKELEYQGFVEKIGNRGTYVAELTEADYRAILDVRIPLEAQAFRRAAPRLTSEAEEELSAAVMRMGTAGERQDLAAFHASDVAFHRRIWDLAANKYLVLCLERLCFRLFVFSVVGRDRSWFRAAIQQHLAMLEALCTRDPDKAQKGFIEATVKYWNTRYGLDMQMEDIPDVVVPADGGKLVSPAR